MLKGSFLLDMFNDDDDEEEMPPPPPPPRMPLIVDDEKETADDDDDDDDDDGTTIPDCAIDDGLLPRVVNALAYVDAEPRRRMLLRRAGGTEIFMI